MIFKSTSGVYLGLNVQKPMGPKSVMGAKTVPNESIKYTLCLSC